MNNDFVQKQSMNYKYLLIPNAKLHKRGPLEEFSGIDQFKHVFCIGSLITRHKCIQHLTKETKCIDLVFSVAVLLNTSTKKRNWKYLLIEFQLYLFQIKYNIPLTHLTDRCYCYR